MRLLRNLVVTFGASAVLVADGLGVSAASASPIAPTPHAARVSGLGPAVAAKPKPKVYKNCTKLNKVYPHGVGKKGAKDKVSGKSKPVTNFTVSKKTYKLNKKSDRDKDGIACEKL